ncbi:MAG: S8 family serine peptidase [Phycisphaerae bacterium]|nr:S8 family serine peptidase [Phycisphaerae bacterium]
MRWLLPALAAVTVVPLWLAGTSDTPILKPAQAASADTTPAKTPVAHPGAAGEPQPAMASLPAHLVRPTDSALPKTAAISPALTAEPQDTTTLLSETFETGFPSGLWAVGGNPAWDDDDFKPYQGSMSAWCARGGAAGVDPATSNYSNNMNTWMIYGPFSLADAQSATLSFYLWLESELNYDFFFWMASIDGNSFYGQKLSSTTNGWVNQTLDFSNIYQLGNVLGQSAVWVAFVFQSDVSITYKGAFVDNVVLTKTIGPSAPNIAVNPTAINLTCTSGAPAPAAHEVEVATPPAPVVPAQKLIDEEEILQSFAKGQARVPVIVNMTRPAAAPARLNFADAAALKPLQNAIKVQQDTVLTRLPANQHRLRHRFQNQPGFSIEVTPQALEQLKQDPEVSSIEPVRTLYPHLSQGLALMNALSYRTTYTGAGVAVAICDTGIDYTHPALGNGGFPNSKVLGGYDFGNNDSDPKPVGQPHGTSCAGIAAGDLATVGDYIGGVAHNAKLYALKISPDNTGNATSDAMIAAWNWCVTHRNDNPDYPIMVISTSFGGGRYYNWCDSSSPSMTLAANNAVAAGITLLVSSGNDGYCDSIGWPACISSVIAVGAVYDAAFGSYLPCVSASSCAPKTSTSGCSTGYYATDTTAADKVTSYSNSASMVGVLAPANRCYTTDIVGSDGYSTGNYTTSFGGTSAACPYAAGAVAVLQSAAKARNGAFLTPAEVRSILTTTGDNITDPKNGLVKPRVNLAAAIDGGTIPAHCVRISNTGSALLTVSSVTKPVWVTLTPEPPYNITPGSTLEVCVAACDVCPGCDVDGTLGLQSNDPDEPLVNVAIHVDCQPPDLPTGVQATPPTICSGESSTLSGTPGGSNATLEWFTDSCGGTKIGEGIAISVSPTATTTYYVRTKALPCNAVSACQAVTVTVNTTKGDLDCDGDVDAQDVALFKACMSGSDTPHAGGLICSRADHEPDGDIDQTDFGILQRCLNGSNQPPVPGCMD